MLEDGRKGMVSWNGEKVRYQSSAEVYAPQELYPAIRAVALQATPPFFNLKIFSATKENNPADVTVTNDRGNLANPLSFGIS